MAYLEGHRYHTWIGHDDFAAKIIALSTVSQAAPAPEISVIHREPSVSAVVSIGMIRSEENATHSQGSPVTLAQANLETRPKNALKKGFRPNFLTAPTRTSSNLPSRLATKQSPELEQSLKSKPSKPFEPGRLLFPASIVDLAQMSPVQDDQLRSVPSAPLAASDSSDSTQFLLSEHKRCKTKIAIHLDIAGQIHDRGSKGLRSCCNIEAFLDLVCKKCNITEASIKTVTVKFPWLEGKPHRQVIRLDQDVGLIKELFDEVDNAPCWQEGPTACCEIMVTVVQKPGWDEDHHQTMLSSLSQP